MWRNTNPGALEGMTLCQIALVYVVTDGAADDSVYSEMEDRAYDIVDMRKWADSCDSPGEFFDSLESTVKLAIGTFSLDGVQDSDILQAVKDLASLSGAIVWQDDNGFWYTNSFDWQDYGKLQDSIEGLYHEAEA